ncbi:calcium-binding protein [Mesorhizobium sp.]|uniref:calcium-binding protein n=1 Tax=Mesorhizobium sp. TaxID=1871066 RepID=UPI00120B8993|nr:calcium-binding protein [Mesorhizobium sp.]TIS49851.1 MAG: hypothetical protein E5W96_10765 [Mesorhizobium sp.]
MTVSADGSSRSQVTQDAGGAVLSTMTDNVTTAVDGSHTETLAYFDANGQLLSRTQTLTSADGRNRTTSYDHMGSGSYDQIETSSITVGSDGVTTTTTSDYDAGGALTYRASTSISADARSKTTSIDWDGNGTTDTILTDGTVSGQNGSAVNTSTETDGSGNLLEQRVVHIGANGHPDAINIDLRKDGANIPASAASIQVGSGIAVTVTGNNDQISLGQNSSVTVIGSNDKYVFVSDSGSDTISGSQSSSSPNENNELDFGAGIDWNELWFAQQGNNLVVSVLGTADEVTINDWFTGTEDVVETIKSGDGKVLHHSDVATLVAAMAGFDPATSPTGSGIQPNDPRLGDPNQTGTIAAAMQQSWMAA